MIKLLRNKWYSGTISELPDQMKSGSKFIAEDTGDIYIFGQTKLPIRVKGEPSLEFVGQLSQVGFSNPTLNTFKNTLGYDPVWSRTGVGVYDLRLTGVRANQVIWTIDSHLINVATPNFKTQIVDDAEFQGCNLIIYTEGVGGPEDNLLKYLGVRLEIYPAKLS